ncbi:14863_t:CDS:1, partial [Acaulospora colombiana]
MSDNHIVSKYKLICDTYRIRRSLTDQPTSNVPLWLFRIFCREIRDIDVFDLKIVIIARNIGLTKKLYPTSYSRAISRRIWRRLSTDERAVYLELAKKENNRRSIRSRRIHEFEKMSQAMTSNEMMNFCGSHAFNECPDVVPAVPENNILT